MIVAYSPGALKFLDALPKQFSDRIMDQASQGRVPRFVSPAAASTHAEYATAASSQA